MKSQCVSPVLAEAEAKGIAEGKAEAIRNALRMNLLTLEQIAELLAVPLEQVVQIQQEQPAAGADTRRSPGT